IGRVVVLVGFEFLVPAFVLDFVRNDRSRRLVRRGRGRENLRFGPQGSFSIPLLIIPHAADGQRGERAAQRERRPRLSRGGAGRSGSFGSARDGGHGGSFPPGHPGDGGSGTDKS